MRMGLNSLFSARAENRTRCAGTHAPDDLSRHGEQRLSVRSRLRARSNDQFTRAVFHLPRPLHLRLAHLSALLGSCTGVNIPSRSKSSHSRCQREIIVKAAIYFRPSVRLPARGVVFLYTPICPDRIYENRKLLAVNASRAIRIPI